MNRRLLFIIFIYTIFLCVWMAVFAPIVDVLYPSNIVRQLFGRYYSINNDRHIETLKFITLQAGIAIDSIEKYHKVTGYYPEHVDSLTVENYPKYITDTFKSKYINISFPRFIYTRLTNENAVADSEYYTLKAVFGRDYLMYHSQYDEWRFYQFGRSLSGHVIVPSRE